MSMNKTLIFILLLLGQTSLFGQDQLWNDRGSIINVYEAYTDTSFRYVIADSGKKITVGIYGSDSLVITHYIRAYQNEKIDDESICDSIVINLLCDSCAEFHMNRMVDSKGRKWVEISDSLYISSKWVSKFSPSDKTPTIYTVPFMKFIQEKETIQILLYTEELTKKRWQELKKGKVLITN